MEGENKNDNKDNSKGVKYLPEANEVVTFGNEKKSDEAKQKQLEALVQKKTKDYQTIIDSVPAMVFYKDKENNFIATNKAFENVMAMPKEKLEGKSLFEIYPKEEAEAFWKDDLEVINSGHAKRNIIEPMDTVNGLRIVQTDKIPHFDENGNAVGVIGFAIDITEQKKAEAALQESQQRYATTLASIGDAVIATDISGKIIFMNPEAEKLTGWTINEATAKPSEEIFYIINEHSRQKVESPINKVLSEGIIASLANHTILIKKDKTEIAIDDSGAPIRNNKGEMTGVVLVFRDITERKKNETEFRRLASFPKLNPNPIVELDLEGNIVYQNPSAMEMFPDLSEKLLSHPFVVDWKTIVEELVDKKKKTTSHEVVVGKKYFHKTIHYLEDLKKIRIYGTDITDRKEKENDLQKLNRTLRAISDSNQLLMKATDETTYLNDVCKTIIEDCGYKMVWVGYAENDENKSIRPVAFAGFDEGYLQILNLTWVDKEHGQGPTGTAIREGKITACENILQDPKFIPWREEAIKRGHASSIAFPMKDSEKIFGAITIYSQEPNPFLEKEIILLKELASDVSYGVTSIRTKKARLEAEELLQKKEVKLQTEKNVLNIVMNNAKAGLAYLDRDFNFVAVNSTYCKNNGRTEEELLGKNHFDFFPSEENKLLFEKVRDSGQQIELTQKPLVSRSQPWQDVTYWDWTLTPVKNSEGHVYGLVISIVDVSERVNSIENLKIHGHKLEQITTELKKVQLAVENASDIIFITDEKGKIIYINRAVKNIMGHKQKELIGRKPNFWMEYMPNKFFAQMWQTIYFDKKPFVGEIQDRKKDGDLFTAEVRIAPVLDKNGQILSFVGIERDITEAKRLDEAKTEFISLAAHQLRTPITSVSLTAEMLLGGLSGKMNKESEEYLLQIMDGVKKMSEMIELFLNVSRIEMKTFEVVPQPANIEKIIEENIKSVMPQIKNKELEFRKNISDDLPVINVDTKVMDIVLENLLTNAIKYTPGKGIISLDAEKYRDNVTIKISDTGCGIPKKHQAKVFEKLYRADNTDKKIEGVGLGLYLCKNLIEQTGGKIWLKSEKDKGSTFYVSIPLSGMKRNQKRK